MALLGAQDAILSITTKEGKFLVLGMTGHEHLGRLFDFSVELAGAVDLLGTPAPVDLFKLLATPATLKMEVSDDPRYFSGMVTRAKRGEKRGRYDTYTVTMQPWLWFLTQTKNSRVFQEKSVKDIVTEVLKDYSGDSEWRTTGDYPKLDYCIQYGETDFDFVSRLLEEVGIYYFFEHADGKHTMVLIDDMEKHKAREAGALKWANALATDATIMGWHSQEEARSVKAVLTEYDYLAPATAIKGEKEVDPPPPAAGGGLAGAAAGALMGGAGGSTQAKVGSSTLEWFEHPALVVQNSAKPEANTASATAATDRAKVRMEELVALSSSATGITNARDFAIGMKFELEDSPTATDNHEYLLVSAVYRLDFADHEAVADLKTESRHEGFRCDFMAMNSKSPTYRSPRTTPKPVVAGPHTAIVVGASGDEILTDKHGRIKVQFHWDRKGENNENSSCWVRCAMPWAGKGYGMFTLPRVGNEVVVQFLDGNPDRPLVMGSVYNKENIPPWTLPLHSTVGGIKTRTSKKGEPENANELRFDDAKDKEYVWFQAEKDYFRTVKNDAFDYVGNNETVKVELTRKEVIGESWFMDVTDDVMHNLGKDLHVNVAGDIFHTGGATYQLKLEKDYNAKIGADLGLDVGGKTQLKSKDDIVLHSTDGKISLKSGKDPMTGSDVLVQAVNVKIKAGATVVLEATTSITLKVGGSLVNISGAGVDIVGTLVKINSGGAGGSASAALSASPVEPTDAKKEDTTTPEKTEDYDKNFDDPMKADPPPAA